MGVIAKGIITHCQIQKANTQNIMIYVYTIFKSMINQASQNLLADHTKRTDLIL